MQSDDDFYHHFKNTSQREVIHYYPYFIAKEWDV